MSTFLLEVMHWGRARDSKGRGGGGGGGGDICEHWTHLVWSKKNFMQLSLKILGGIANSVGLDQTAP